VTPEAFVGLAPHGPMALRHDHALEPSGKRVRVAHLVQAAPGDQQRLLGGVLGGLAVLQDRIGAAKGHVLKPAHDLGKGVLFFGQRGRRACPRPAQQVGHGNAGGPRAVS
jgi:hypothetical protein